MQTIQSQQTEINKAIKDINFEIELLQKSKNEQLDLYNLTQKERSIGLVRFYNHMVNYKGNMVKGENSINWYSDSELISDIKVALHRRSQNRTRYRSKLERLQTYINVNTEFWVDKDDLQPLVRYYKTYNSRLIVKRLQMVAKLNARKQASIALLLPKVDRYKVRKGMDKYDKAHRFFNDKFDSFYTKTQAYFREKLSKNNVAEYYSISLGLGYNGMINMYNDFLEKRITVKSYKKHIFAKLLENYRLSVKHDKQVNSQTDKYMTSSEIREKARNHHKLSTMKRKDRLKVIMDKWLKVKNTMEMFKVPTFDSKIDFSMINAKRQAENAKINAKKVLNSIYGNTKTKTVINNCGVVEYHTITTDITGNTKTEIAIFA